jgi:peptidoglycan/xylan/chitin deacetylase (PgdA/CDA1 family)
VNPVLASEFVTKLLLNALYFSGSASLANKHLRGMGAVLMLHRVNDTPQTAFSPNAHLTVSPAFLDDTLKRLKASIYQFVSMDEAARRLSGSSAGRGDRPFLAVTLDDGYRDNLENAVPLFRKYNIPYTIYIAPGLVDGRARLWWEDLEAIIASRKRIDLDMPGGRVEWLLETPAQKHKAFSHLLEYFTTSVDESEQRRLLNDLCWLYQVDSEKRRSRSIMDWKQLKELSRDPLCTLGAHTICHYAVARLKESEARFEIGESARLIELETGRKPAHFAYPYGYPAAAGPRDFSIVSELGFATGATTRHGVCYPTHGEHMTALPRISLNGKYQKYKYVKTLLSGSTGRIANRGRQLNID